jgi:glucose-6-phosphate-specific signal transduction histidine kinase
VDELVEQARAAGQQAEVEVGGRPEEAPAAHRPAVHRLVQEALTNAREHAGGAPVRIRLGYGPPATTVEVTSAPGSPAAHAVASGFGLVGLADYKGAQAPPRTTRATSPTTPWGAAACARTATAGSAGAPCS